MKRPLPVQTTPVLRFPIAPLNDYCRRITLGVLLAAIFVLAGCSPKRLVEPPEPGFAVEANPAWSHSGTEVAFRGLFDINGNYSPDIYLTDTAGSFRRPTRTGGIAVRWLPGDSLLIINAPTGFILYDRFADTTSDLGFSSEIPPFDISSDGKYVYYTGTWVDSIWSMAIHRHSLINGSDTALIDGEFPALNSSDSLLTFSRYRVFTLNLETGASDSILEPSGRFAVWVGAERLIYETRTGIVSYQLATGQVHPLGPGYGTFDVSPDGLRLLYVGAPVDNEGFQHLWIMRVDGSFQRKLFR